MTISTVLRQFATTAAVDAARVPVLSGYIKRVTLIVPETTRTAPTGDAAAYYGPPVDGTYTRKSSLSVTYTPPSGAKVSGPGSVATPAASVTSTLVTGAAYPYFLVFVSGDGSEFLLNMSTVDTPSGSSTASSETNAREVSVPYVPVDRTLLAALASDEWTTGTVAEFEAIRTSTKIW